MQGALVMKKMFLAAAAASLMISSAAYAAVTYDPATGGFAGKGDIQSAFGWNNTQLQLSAGDITFRWGSTADYDVVCMWITGPDHNRKSHRVTTRLEGQVGATVASGTRTGPRDQVTGFNLQPVSASSSSAPYRVGDSCDAEDVDGNAKKGTIESVTLIGGGSTGGLYVSDGTTEVLLLAAS